eukprot:2418048-Rhodomonas_salina.1
MGTSVHKVSLGRGINQPTMVCARSADTDHVWGHMPVQECVVMPDDVVAMVKGSHLIEEQCGGARSCD